MDLGLRRWAKGIVKHGLKGSKHFLELDFVDDFSILDESMRKMNELLDVLQVQGATIGLKINV